MFLRNRQNLCRIFFGLLNNTGSVTFSIYYISFHITYILCNVALSNFLQAQGIRSLVIILLRYYTHHTRNLFLSSTVLYISIASDISRYRFFVECILQNLMAYKERKVYDKRT